MFNAMSNNKCVKYITLLAPLIKVTRCQHKNEQIDNHTLDK